MYFKMLLEKCQIWNEDGNYAKIIEELEKIPYENRTPETDSEACSCLCQYSRA